MEELSQATRISRPFLEALEKDDFHFFPQRAFISGFLKGYARYLGLDSEEVLRRYQVQSELEGRKETFRQLSLFPSIPSGAEEIEESEKEPQNIPLKVKRRFNWKIFIKLAVVLIALGLSLYLHYLLREMESRPPDLKSEPILNPVDGKKGLEPPPKKIKIIGNRENKFYYLPGMKGYGNTDPVHRLEFDTEEEAIKAGFRLAPQGKNTGR